jgi:hypothetical protein
MKRISRDTIAAYETRVNMGRTEVTDRRDSVVENVRDTLREVTTITVRENEWGDTIRMSVVTDRDRVRERAAVRDKEEKVIMKTDTVFVAVRDSVDVRNYETTELQSGGTALHRTLKWIFCIIVAVTVLVVVIRVKSPWTN